jgi:hypothetical protein
MATEQRDDAATIRLLREECKELQTRVHWLFEARMDALRELERAKWNARYWAVIASVNIFVIVAALVTPAILALWR